MIVLDASAAIEVLLDTESGRRIEARVWGDARELPNAPHLLDVEVAQVMGRLVRARRLEADLARAVLLDLRDFDLVRHPHTDLLERALQMRDNVTAYDAVYLALAEALDATLVTCDAKLTKVPGCRAKVSLVC